MRWHSTLVSDNVQRAEKESHLSDWIENFRDITSNSLLSRVTLALKRIRPQSARRQRHMPNSLRTSYSSARLLLTSGFNLVTRGTIPVGVRSPSIAQPRGCFRYNAAVYLEHLTSHLLLLLRLDSGTDRHWLRFERG
jgi:hypothetical protein